MMPHEVDLDRTVIERVDARLGTSLGGRYRLDYKIASGGFGAVYHAFDTVARREVAVKVLHAALATDAAVTARFQREIHALAQLRDPHTVVAYDAGEAPDGSLFLVMELLGGESLFERYTAQGPLPWPTVVKLARGVCCSLAEAHELGIVHRDLKPANIHIEQRANERDYVKVLDFGIAKLRDGSPDADVTHVGQMVGTFDYMAPEQMAGNCLPQSDVFTLGIVIYEMIAGERPFGTAPGPAAMLAALLGKTPERLVQVPPLLADIVARCLAREPEDRYANASELADALAGLGERIEHEAPTVPARASSSFIGGADSMLDGATVVDRRKPDGKPEIPRVTLPGVIPHPPRPSIPRLAAGTVDPFPSPFDYAPPQAPAIPPTLPPHQVQQLRAPSPMFDIDLRPKPVWPLVLFIAIAIAVGIAIGIGFAT
ncbi:MAG TPA: serine/threonine-protein kinase [Kofleriaceae bacterium]|jgi:serine/threonine protein kinase